jgi:hypothetical protein
VGLAATAGWDEEALDLIRGKGADLRPFYDRLVAPVLVDLASGQSVYNQTDERLDHLAPLFSMELELDVVNDAMASVEALFSAGRTGVLQSEIVERDRVSPDQVSLAFDRLAASGKYRIQEVDKQDRLLSRRSA